MIAREPPRDRWRGAKITFSLLMLLCVIAASVAALLARDWIVFAGLLILVFIQIRFNIRFIRSQGARTGSDPNVPGE
jgi:uncharacterized membrane protein